MEHGDIEGETERRKNIRNGGIRNELEKDNLLVEKS